MTDPLTPQAAREERLHREEVVRDREAEWPTQRRTAYEERDVPDEFLRSGRNRRNSRYGDSDE